MFYFVALMCGLVGAYLGVHAVLSLFAAVAVVAGMQFAVARIRKALGHRNA
jgi:hypothetical protein